MADYQVSRLFGEQLKTAIKRGQIAFSLLDDSKIDATGINLTLGSNYYRIEKSNVRSLYNPFDSEDIERYFDGPYKALTLKNWCQLNGHKLLRNLDEQCKIIELKAGERIIGHSQEFVGISENYSFSVKNSSFWVKNGILLNINEESVAPNFIGRVVFNIININPSETLLLPVGKSIAKAEFTKINKLDITKIDNKINLRDIIDYWSPEHLIGNFDKNNKIKE